MNGMTVCIEPTSAQEKVLDDVPGIIKKPVDKIDDALLNIQYGKADAALVEPAIARKFQRAYPAIKTLNVELTPKNQVYGIGIALKKENKTLINDIQQAIDRMTETNFIKQCEAKWLTE